MKRIAAPESTKGRSRVDSTPSGGLTRSGRSGGALSAGLVFGTGLMVSGMANPAKVIGFLDLAGAWDPSLALVMAGAIAVGLVAFAMANRRKASFLGAEMQLPKARQVDRRLIGGSMLFGIGWGIAGFCPGPSLVALGLGETKAVAFVAAMLLGMSLFELLERGRRARLHNTTKAP